MLCQIIAVCVTITYENSVIAYTISYIDFMNTENMIVCCPHVTQYVLSLSSIYLVKLSKQIIDTKLPFRPLGFKSI